MNYKTHKLALHYTHTRTHTHAAPPVTANEQLFFENQDVCGKI